MESYLYRDFGSVWLCLLSVIKFCECVVSVCVSRFFVREVYVGVFGKVYIELLSTLVEYVVWWLTWVVFVVRFG